MPLPPYIKRPRGGDPRDRGDYQTMFARAEGAVAAPTAGLHFTPALICGIVERGVGIGLEDPDPACRPRHLSAGQEHRPALPQDACRMGHVPAETAEQIAAARRDGGRIIAVGTTSLRLLVSSRGRNRRNSRPSPARPDCSFILPGYRFRAIDVLLTNFHLPRSTLFMLVAALAGHERIKAAYTHAIAAGYRFFSYGDACLIERRPG